MQFITAKTTAPHRKEYQHYFATICGQQKTLLRYLLSKLTVSSRFIVCSRYDDLYQ